MTEFNSRVDLAAAALEAAAHEHQRDHRAALLAFARELAAALSEPAPWWRRALRGLAR